MVAVAGDPALGGQSWTPWWHPRRRCLFVLAFDISFVDFPPRGPVPEAFQLRYRGKIQSDDDAAWQVQMPT
ncbi:hypothetical protein DTO280E4_4801 [Paecilomyces variotii]|nr:hypothetical protein DTO280E4_4801 [Paecilomyces variotii]